MAHYRKTLRHPQNQKCIIYRNDPGGGPSHSHGQHAQEIW